MSSTKSAKDKAAMHADALCTNSQQSCMRHDRPLLTLQQLSTERAARGDHIGCASYQRPPVL